MAYEVENIYYLALYLKKNGLNQAPVAHVYNPSYLRGQNRKDCDSKTAQANSSRHPISKITREKWTRGVDQVKEHLFCKRKALTLNSSPFKKKKKGLTTILQ
jgi:hypothetical protein